MFDSNLICIVSLAIVIPAVLFFAFALCKISSISDEQAERQWEARSKDNDI